MKLLLDAHALLWALYEPERLADRARNEIADETNELFVSLATLWEITNKAAMHRLPLVGSSLERIVERIEELGVVFLPILQSEIVTAAALPRRCVWQLGLAHFGSLFWPTPGTLGLRGYCSVLLERSP